MYPLLFELLLKIKITILNFCLFLDKRKKMDKIIYHVPKEEFLTLRFLFQKNEEEYCKIARKFNFLISVKSFFERINYLEEKIIINKQFNENKKESEEILQMINNFKEEHYYNVMEKKQYSCLLFFEKKKDNEGFFGWVPSFYRNYKIDLKDKNYNERKKLCFLTENEEKFKNTYKEKFNFLALFFKDELYYDGLYNILTDYILEYKRKYFQKIRSSCDHGPNFVCPSDNLCRAHKFIFFIEKIFEAITHCVVEEKIYYKYFLFVLKKKNDFNGDIDGWDFFPSEYKDLSNLSYSKRLSFLK